MLAHLFEYLNNFFEKLPLAVLKFRWLILSACIVITGFMTYSIATRFNMDMSMETFFAEDHPVRVTLNQFRQQFGSDDGLYIVYEAKDGDVFSEKSIATIAQLHQEIDDARVARGEQASMLNRIESIDSLYNARLQKVDGDTLISQKLLATDFPANEQEREAKRATALTQDTFKLAYFSEDFRYGGIRIKTDFGTIPKSGAAQKTETAEQDLLMDDFAFQEATSTSEGLNYNENLSEQVITYETTQMDEYLGFMDAVRVITQKPEYEHFTFHYSGNAAMMEFTMKTMTSGSFLIAGMLFMIMFLLFALFRSFSATVWTLLVMVLSALWPLGLFTLFDITLSNLVILTVMLILVVGTATCVHVINTYVIYRQQGLGHEAGIGKTYRQTGVPIIFTSATTIVGMLTMLTSSIPQLAVFGVNAALGVTIVFLLVMLLFPILLDFWHPYKGKVSAEENATAEIHWVRPFLEKIPDFTQRYSITIFIIFLAFFAWFVYGTLQLKVDTNMVKNMREGSDMRVSAEIINAHMMGVQTMEVMLDFGEPNALKDPQILKSVEAFQKHAQETYPEFVIKTFSLADYVKETNKAMNEDREEFKVIPDDPIMAAQLLYMFDNSNPEDRRNLVSDDYSKSHITIQLRNAGSYEYADMFASLDQGIKDYFEVHGTQYTNTRIQVTGTLPMMMKLVDMLSWGQVKSFTSAFIIISLFLVFATGSWVGGAIAVLPNILPALSTFGLMGAMGIALSANTLVVAPIIIGIAVDDTIHMMSHYRARWFATGDVHQSIVDTIHEVGQAVVFTSIILSLGFGVMMFSEFDGIAKIGSFGTFAIIIAMICDIVLLPALLYIFKPDLGRKKYLASLEQTKNNSTK